MPTVATRPPQHANLKVSIRKVSRRHLAVELIGDVDVAASNQVTALVSLIVASDPTQVDLDLGRVAFIDLGGLRTVGCLVEDLRAQGIVCDELAASLAVARLRELVERLGDAPPVRAICMMRPPAH